MHTQNVTKGRAFSSAVVWSIAGQVLYIFYKGGLPSGMDHDDPTPCLEVQSVEVYANTLKVIDAKGDAVMINGLPFKVNYRKLESYERAEE